VSAPADVPASNRGRVLVADDSRVVRMIVAGYLKDAGYEVSEAGSGDEAVARLGREPLDVIITDLSMPGLDGFGVLEAAKRAGSGIEVIILTGAHADDMAAAVRAIRLGAHDYLVKPPSMADDVLIAVERAVEKKRLRDTNERLMKQLETLSLTDALTGVGNRRAFSQALEREAARAVRYKHALSLALLDIDHFKKINDGHGHEAGDEVLRQVAQTAAAVLRKGDSFYRYGGEEFVAILPVAEPPGAAEVARRLIAAIAGRPIRIGAHGLSVTASVGVATLGVDGPEATLGRADAALYEAKRSGRNRVCAAPAPS
jgi:diguanylate cyclase (GGDEF)-like protein